MNAHGDLVQTIKAIGSSATSTISLAYDAVGNLTQTTDTNGNHLTNLYDLRGRKTQTTDPDMGLWRYQYDGLGEPKQRTDAKNEATDTSTTYSEE